MVLAATVEAAADLDVQILHCFVLLKALLADTLAELGREAARRRNPQLASISARAGRNIDQSAGAGVAEPDGIQRREQLAHIALAHPADRKILLDRCADGFFGEPPDDVRQRPQLIRRDVAERQSYCDSDVSRLLLRTRVVLQPLLEPVRVAVKFLDRDQRRQFPARLAAASPRIPPALL